MFINAVVIANIFWDGFLPARSARYGLARWLGEGGRGG